MKHFYRQAIRLAALLAVGVLALLPAVTGVFASNQPGSGALAPQQVFRGVYIKSHRVTVNIDNQLAVTKVEQVFVNEGQGLAEGTYLFPLPPGAAVSDLALYIDGQVVKPQLLDAKQAQAIYTEIVRRQRDPVLLQYIGRGAIQASIFPIPAGAQRKIEITYSHILSAENGLINYAYPLKTDYASPLPVQQLSVSVTVTSKDPIGTAYSPNPLVAVSRVDDRTVRAGMEAANYRAVDDFSLYYSVATGQINANLLTYRGSANEDGFFMLMVTPPSAKDALRVIPKDVILVLDQSGSMAGEKWQQARAAARYVLKNLNKEDRFNAVVFSTGYRIYAKTLQPVAEAEKAAQWIDGLEAIGGTDINTALTQALAMLDRDRFTTVLFLTDGLPTEGVTNARGILDNVGKAINPKVRMFAFGVGNDVDTFLLDSLSSSYGGVSVYVRPNEDIEQKVSALYNKITSPVLTALKLDFDKVMIEDMYPSAPLPDLFAGSQLIVVGRFRDGGTSTATLIGQLYGEAQTYKYPNLSFPANAGGQPFIARLWATRKIGALLNQIRLSGEKPELVDSVVRLSIRYGIITPYTSFLIQEEDINARRDGVGLPPGTATAPGTPRPMLAPTQAAGSGGGASGPAQSSGATAVAGAAKSNEMAGADRAAPPPTAFAALATKAAVGTAVPGVGSAPIVDEVKGTGRANEPIKQVNDRTFVLRDGIWTDTLYTSDKMKLVPVVFLSDDYFKLLEQNPQIKDFLAIGNHLVIVIGNTAYEIKPQ